jgi:hypothetical protein
MECKKPIGELFAPVFFLRSFLHTVWVGYFQLGTTVVTDDDFALFHIRSQFELSSTHRTRRHNSPPKIGLILSGQNKEKDIAG